MKPGKLSIVVGDATRPESKADVVIIAHCCNDCIPGRWGSGFVIALNKTFGENTAMASYQEWSKYGSSKILPVSLSSYCVEYADNYQLGNTQFVLVKQCSAESALQQDIYVANMIGQHNTGYDENGLSPVRYGAIACAMAQVGEWAMGRVRDGLTVEIVCPRFGSGLAGGDQNVIQALIQNIWVERGLNVTIYEFSPAKNIPTEKKGKAGSIFDEDL